MTVVIPAGFAQVIYEFVRTGDPDPYNVIFGIDISSDPDLATARGQVTDTFGTWLAPQMNNAQTLTQVTVQTEFQIDTLAANIPGEVAAQDLPPNCAVLVSKTTNFRGRATRGRNYWPGFIAEGSVDGVGQIDSDDLAGLQDAFANWGAELVLEGYPVVILHDETSPITTPTLVTNFVVSPTIATQRRRLR